MPKKIIDSATNKNIPVACYIDIPISADSIDSACQFKYFDADKALKLLHWQLDDTFAKIIDDTYAWMIKNDIIEK